MCGTPGSPNIEGEEVRGLSSKAGERIYVQRSARHQPSNFGLSNLEEFTEKEMKGKRQRTSYLALPKSLILTFWPGIVAFRSVGYCHRGAIGTSDH